MKGKMKYEEKLNDLFKELKIKANIISYKLEDDFLTFDLSLHSGGKFKQIEKYSTEIALVLKAIAEPLIYPVMNEGIIRMEVILREQSNVLFDNDYKNISGKLPLILGGMKDGNPLIIDLANAPHILIGGATGSGKSIILHSIICGLIGRAKLVLIDPKRVEFNYYNDLKDLYLPITRSVDCSIKVLEKLNNEMERRFKYMEKKGLREIEGMPYIVVIIDEMADLMSVAKKEVQELLCRLAQKSRACGIHIIIATQRPSVDVITGLIKANFPARIAFKVASNADSRVILDRGGAEKLLGNGDAIIHCSEYDFKRFKGSYLGEEEILELVGRKNWWSKLWHGPIIQ